MKSIVLDDRVDAASRIAASPPARAPGLVSSPDSQSASGEVGRERRAALGRPPKERRRSAQERAPRVEVAAVEGARPAEARRSDARPRGRRAPGRRVELGAVPVRLLEVVADDLVALYEVVAGKPVGEALVQLGAGRLRQRLVGGVANEEVAKAKPFVLGKRRRRGADELLANERREVRLRRRRAPERATARRRRRDGRPRPRPRRAP